jgi:hypothetical protein
MMVRHKVNWEREDKTRVVFHLSVGRNWLDVSDGRVLLAAPGITVAKTDEQHCANLWCWTIDTDGGAILSKNSINVMTFVGGGSAAGGGGGLGMTWLSSTYTFQFDDIEGDFTYYCTPTTTNEPPQDDSQETVVAMGSSSLQQQEQPEPSPSTRLSQLSTQSLEHPQSGSAPTDGCSSSFGMTSQFALETDLSTQMDDGRDSQRDSDSDSDDDDEASRSAKTAARNDADAADRRLSIAPPPEDDHATITVTTMKNDDEEAPEESAVAENKDDSGDDDDEKAEEDGSSDTDETVDPQTATDLVRSRQSRQKEIEDDDNDDDDDNDAHSRNEYFTAETSDFTSLPATPAKGAKGDVEEERNIHSTSRPILASPSILQENQDQTSVTSASSPGRNDEKKKQVLPDIMEDDSTATSSEDLTHAPPSRPLGKDDDNAIRTDSTAEQQAPNVAPDASNNILAGLRLFAYASRSTAASSPGRNGEPKAPPPPHDNAKVDNEDVQEHYSPKIEGTITDAPPIEMCDGDDYNDDDRTQDVDDDAKAPPAPLQSLTGESSGVDDVSNEKSNTSVVAAELEASTGSHHKSSVEGAKATVTLTETIGEVMEEKPDRTARGLSDESTTPTLETSDVPDQKADDDGEGWKQSSLKVGLQSNVLEFDKGEDGKLPIEDERQSDEHIQSPGSVTQAGDGDDERSVHVDLRKHSGSDVGETTESGAALEIETTQKVGAVVKQQEQIDIMTNDASETDQSNEEDGKGEAILEADQSKQLDGKGEAILEANIATKLLSHHQVCKINKNVKAMELENGHSDKLADDHQGERTKEAENCIAGEGDTSEDQSKKSLATQERTEPSVKSRSRKRPSIMPTDLPPLPTSRTRARKAAHATENTDTDLEFPDHDTSPADSPVKKKTKSCDSVPKSNGRPTRKRVGTVELAANNAIEATHEKRSASKRKASDSPITASTSTRKTPRKRTGGTPSKKSAEVRILVTGVVLTEDQEKVRHRSHPTFQIRTHG